VSGQAQQLAGAAEQVLARNPAAPARVRLLRDVLGRRADDAELRQARAELEHCRWVVELAAEQRADGGWGAFHSRDTRLKQKIPTTEAGIERAVALGLTEASPVLAKARDYLAGLLANPAAFPDYPEKNDRWPTGVAMFLAGTLAQFSPSHPALKPAQSLWIRLAERTFASGGYGVHNEIAAHAELTGATVAGSYLRIGNRYAAAILSSAPELLPPEVEQAYLNWLWRKPDGLIYLEEMPSAMPPPVGYSGRLDRWLVTCELLSRFPRFHELSAGIADWLWSQCTADGLWDLGPRGSTSTWFPLAYSWRKPLNRRLDWSTRVLVLLSKLSGSS
jgi:hypothetical protein